ncbi:metallophosphoesterase [Stutzerimonas nosocomialis]|uniref:metallophosphoesterase n=1 Tax=Stutzerimonas nosocomialis TaxID=1056496 RepID=UPI0011087136|nr:metallophosphoesterase [Stutzerimonas nosocomialis]TLX56657.1 metallophosphoesterase [Stutzerimonas nosocomialis]TLX59640.1 metallophosphoesterase [Stutzerimonas nosocomialis]
MRSRLMILLVLAGLHLFVGVTLIPDLALGPVGTGAAWLYLVISCLLLPMGVQRQGRAWLAWTALLVMGVFSSLAVLALLRALVLAILSLTGLDWPGFAHGSALAVLGLVVALTLFGLFNARRVARVVEREIALDGLPASLHGFTIVQLSDIHVGPTIKRGYLDGIVTRTNALSADLIAITGDLVDGSVEGLRDDIAPLADLNARHGTLVVTGNHEYYSGAKAWVAEFERLGLRVLLNQHVRLAHEGGELVVAGVTDYSAGHFHPDHRSDPQAALAGAPAEAPKILLAHQPRSATAAREAGYDLQLSGHTHGGQFWPWMHFVRWQQPWVAGLQRAGRLQVYISRGTGYWGPPLRFGAPSEITRIRLVPAR